jgi:hypothetical protein
MARDFCSLAARFEERKGEKREKGAGYLWVLLEGINSREVSGDGE